jgi:hypothetical protein
MPNILMFADDALRVVARRFNPNVQHGVSDEDLSNYGPGESYVQFQRQQTHKPFQNNWKPMQSDRPGFYGGVPQIAFSSFHTQRGEVLPTFVGNSVGIASYPAASAIIGAATRFMIPALLAPAAPLVVPFIAAVAAYRVGSVAAKGVRYFSKFGYKQRHIEMGGDYQDTETAQALRMRAVSDMSSAMSYSRRWLGNEALFMR